MDNDKNFKRTITAGLMSLFIAFAGIEGVDIVLTSSNTDKIEKNVNVIDENESRSIENNKELLLLKYKVEKLEENDNKELKLPRLCICVREDDELGNKRKICPIACDTRDNVRQCESINPGYQCG